MKLDTFSRIACFCFCLTLQMPGQAFAESLIDEGTRYYNEANFGKASHCFEAEIKANPKNAHAHYMMGNIFAELSREQEAVQEYQQALRLAPHGATAQYCERALSAIVHKASPPNASDLNRAVLSKPAHPATSQNTEMNAIRNSASKISTQTTESETHATEECEARIRDVNRDAERQIADLQREQQERLDNRPRTYSRRGTVIYDGSAEMAAIKEEITGRIGVVKEQQAKKIAELRVSFKARQSAAEDAAITLDKQYVNRDASSNVRLSPTGTSVYVRSYETSDEPSGRAVPVALPPARSLDSIKTTGAIHKETKKAQ